MTIEPFTNKQNIKELLDRQQFFEDEFNHIENYQYYSLTTKILFCSFCGKKIGWSKVYDGYKKLVDHLNKEHFQSNPEDVLSIQEIILRMVGNEKKFKEELEKGFFN